MLQNMGGVMNEKQDRQRGPIKQIDLARLRKDLQTIMDEIDSTPAAVLDAYSPRTWVRFRNTTEKVATAINAVRLRLTGKTCAEIAVELGLSKRQVAGYVAWNTMLQPGWMSPAEKLELQKVVEDYVRIA
jgi:predicted transcriptional regulator